MKNLFLSAGLIFLLSVGCAHNHKVEGHHQNMEIPAGIKVTIGSSEVSDGETVDVLAPACHVITGGRGQKKKECHEKKVGEAKVLKVIDSKSAIVEPLKNLKMTTDMSVEKQKGAP